MSWTYSIITNMDLVKDSCKSQLIISVEDTGRQLDQQHWVDILILDFAKASDMVQHSRLLMKLKYYRVRGRTLIGYKAGSYKDTRQSYKLDTKLACTKAPHSHSRWKEVQACPSKVRHTTGYCTGAITFPYLHQ